MAEARIRASFPYLVEVICGISLYLDFFDFAKNKSKTTFLDFVVSFTSCLITCLNPLKLMKNDLIGRLWPRKVKKVQNL